MAGDVFRVVREEYHVLSLCPCPECERERERRRQAAAGPTNNHIIHVSPQAAFAVGLISRLNPHGSLARELSLKSRASDGN